jgi:hypothetical protein
MYIDVSLHVPVPGRHFHAQSFRNAGVGLQMEYVDSRSE